MLMVTGALAKELVQHFHSALRVAVNVPDTMYLAARVVSDAVERGLKDSIVLAKHWVLASGALRRSATVSEFVNGYMDAQLAQDFLCRRCHFPYVR